MSDRNDNDTPTELGGLSQLRSAPVPPPWLEDEVASNLRRSGLLLPSPGRHRWRRYLLASAAAVLLFLAGAVTGARWSPNSPAPVQRGQFLLLLDGSELSAGLPPNQLEKLVQEYADWAGQLRQAGVLVLANKLDEEGRILADDTVKEGAGPLSGFFLIQADTYDQAVETALNCPHLRHGGTVEVRQIDR